MIRGTTRSGFTFELDEAALDDMELFEALCDLEAGDGRAVVPICRRLLGDQKAALYEHLRGGNGRVSVAKVADELADIIGSAKNGKKS